MTQRNRRFIAPTIRRGRMWTTTTGFDLTMVAGDVGVASQKFNIGISSAFETKTGRSLRGVTISKIFFNGFYHTDVVVTTPILNLFSLAIGIYPEGMDEGDFPDLAAHAGDWLMHDTRILSDRGSATSFPIPLEPNSAGNEAGFVFRIVNSSMRKVQRDTDKVQVVVQKRTVCEENITLTAAVTALWLMPLGS